MQLACYHSSLKNCAWRSTWKYSEIYENWCCIKTFIYLPIWIKHDFNQVPIILQQTFLCLYFMDIGNLTKCIVSQHRISPLDPMIYVYFFSKQTLLLTSTYNVNLGKGFLWPLSSAASKKEVIVWLLFSYIVGEVYPLGQILHKKVRVCWNLPKEQSSRVNKFFLLLHASEVPSSLCHYL